MTKDSHQWACYLSPTNQNRGQSCILVQFCLHHISLMFPADFYAQRWHSAMHAVKMKINQGPHFASTIGGSHKRQKNYVPYNPCIRIVHTSASHGYTSNVGKFHHIDLPLWVLGKFLKLCIYGICPHRNQKSYLEKSIKVLPSEFCSIKRRHDCKMQESFSCRVMCEQRWIRGTMELLIEILIYRLICSPVHVPRRRINVFELEHHRHS